MKFPNPSLVFKILIPIHTYHEQNHSNSEDIKLPLFLLQYYFTIVAPCPGMKKIWFIRIPCFNDSEVNSSHKYSKYSLIFPKEYWESLNYPAVHERSSPENVKMLLSCTYLIEIMWGFRITQVKIFVEWITN